MPFNFFTKNTEKPLSGCRLPMTIVANAMTVTADFVPKRRRVVAIRQSEESKQYKENSVPVHDFIAGHGKGCCGFATGVDVDV